MKLKQLVWVGSSKSDLLEFPSVHSKILKGFGGAGVLEIIESDDSGTFRVVYTLKIANFVFVLHAFQKKSKQGIKTPKPEIDLIKKRLKDAQEIYKDLTHEEKI